MTRISLVRSRSEAPQTDLTPAELVIDSNFFLEEVPGSLTLIVIGIGLWLGTGFHKVRPSSDLYPSAPTRS